MVVITKYLSPDNRLATVLLPGPIQPRARLAANLPVWLVLPVAIVCFAFSIELIIYIYYVAQAFLQVMYDRWDQTFQIPRNASWVFLQVAMSHARLHVFNPAGSRGSLMVAAGMALCAVALLESINLVMLAPLAARYGHPFRAEAGRTRRVLLSMGGAWLLSYCLVWLILLLSGGAALLYSVQTLRIRVSFTALDTMVHVGFGAVLLAVLLIWLVRLMHAASDLSRLAEGPLPQRCSQCGYLLQGLPAGSGCPDCGQVDPSAADRQRRPTPWQQRTTIGSWQALVRTSRGVARQPALFFGQMQTLHGVGTVLGFLRNNLWLSIAAWILAVPGIASALIEPAEFLVGNQIASAFVSAALLAMMLALCGTLLVGLLISLLGVAIGIAREEAAWPIAAAAGLYLSAWLPRISGAQALWITGLFTVEQVTHRGIFLWMARRAWLQTGIPWEICLSAIFALPMLVGLVLIGRTALICYRQIRYAGH